MALFLIPSSLMIAHPVLDYHGDQARIFLGQSLRMLQIVLMAVGLALFSFFAQLALFRRLCRRC